MSTVQSYEVYQKVLRFAGNRIPVIAVYVTCDDNDFSTSKTLYLSQSKAQAIANIISNGAYVSIMAASSGWTGNTLTEYTGIPLGEYTYENDDGSKLVVTMVQESYFQFYTPSIYKGSLMISRGISVWANGGVFITGCSVVFVNASTGKLLASSTEFNQLLRLTLPVGSATASFPAAVRDNFIIGTPSGFELYTTNQPDRWYNVIECDVPLENLSTDPYAQGEISQAGGGTGTFSDTGDIIGVPDLPTLSAVDTGFIQLFKPDLSQLRSLANVLWSDSFYTNFIKSFANPMDVILGLGIVPVDVPVEADPREVAAGNIGTGVNMPVASRQYVRVECGSLNIQEFWGAYLDYNPYTKLSIYLPYIGIKPLDIDAYMGKTITVTYHIDILTGACVAYILANGTQMATWAGQCMAQIPVNSQQYPNIVSGVLGIATGAGALLLGGAGMAGIGAAAGASMLVQSNMMIGGASGVLSSAANINKHTAEHSGNLGSTAGMMGVQTPYLILERPSLCIPNDQNALMGYPSFITATLGDLEGYTEVSAIHLNNIPATEEELVEIERLLKEGVII